ncbi:hypothetical protein [Nocardiopsis sp. ATB16-24]|uniref:hypothetical protein n=1 Tax=Nocardiopsis sp. ATB16-24 TaxID=3019555 RepID=UPI002552E9EA|nr:hypothetical protein [Nocardiopsis sp. ATB16-24]
MSHHRSPQRAHLIVAALALPLVLSGCSGNKAEIEAVCAEIHAEISAVELAAESIYTDLLVDGVPYQDEHADRLETHLANVEYLEELSRGEVRADAGERADAIDEVLVQLNVGDEIGLEDAIGWTAETHDLILAACGY